MHRIGETLKAVRLSEGLSVQEVAKGICSPKYIYLIEKGDRTPSLLILSKLNKKFKFDLYTIFPFSECQDPLYYAKIHADLSQYRSFYNVAKLKATLSSLPDFETMTMEMKQFILYNQAILALFDDHDLYAANHLITKALELSKRKAILSKEYYTGASANELNLYLLLVSVNKRLHPTENLLEIINELIDYVLSATPSIIDESLCMIAMQKIVYLYEQEAYQDAIDFIEYISPKMSSSPKLGLNVLYYHKGRIYQQLNKTEEASICYDIAEDLSKLVNQTALEDLIQKNRKVLYMNKLSENQYYTSDLIDSEHKDIDFSLFDSDTIILKINQISNAVIDAFTNNFVQAFKRIKNNHTIYLVFDLSDLASHEFELDVLKMIEAQNTLKKQALDIDIHVFNVFDKHEQGLRKNLSPLGIALKSIDVRVQSIANAPTTEDALHLIQTIKQTR